MKCIFYFTLALVFISPSVYSQSIAAVDIASPGMGEKLNAHLQQLQMKGFSGAVIVEHKGEKVLQAGYGYADRKNKNVAIRQELKTMWLPLTKQFTASVLFSSQKGYFQIKGQLRKVFTGNTTPSILAYTSISANTFRRLIGIRREGLRRPFRKEIFKTCQKEVFEISARRKIPLFKYRI